MRTSLLKKVDKTTLYSGKAVVSAKAYRENMVSFINQFNIYKSIYNAVPCYITMQDRAFFITQANERVIEDFGTTAGRHCYELYKHRNEKCHDCCIERSFHDGKPHMREEPIFLNGENRHILVHAFPVFDEHRHVSHVIEIATDITRLKRTEKLAVLGQTLSGIAHSIKNVVSLMDAGTYLVNNGLIRGEQEKISKGWSMIQGNITRLSDTVLCLLNYAKDAPSIPEPVEMNRIIEDVAVAIKEKLAREHIKFSRASGKGIKTIYGDSNGLYHAVLNLADNAIDACRMDKGKKSRYSITIKSSDYKGIGCLVSVKDNGCGISRRNKDNIFKGYFTTKNDRGTGLGLLTTENIIAGHGGMITFESSPQGTVFSIYIPYRRH